MRIGFRSFGKDAFQSLTNSSNIVMYRTIWQDYPNISKSWRTSSVKPRTHTKTRKAQRRGGIIPAWDQRQSARVWEGFPEDVAFVLFHNEWEKKTVHLETGGSRNKEA